MNLNLKHFLAPALLAGLLSITGAQSLKLGDKAPDLKVAKWVKGQPIAKLDAGKVNVVEFWATWCGPCKVSIPHLTELQKKYGDRVTFTGVSVWESRGTTWDPGTHAKVEKFVTDMGEKMDYTIAADGEDGTMAETWMRAAGQSGIPSAFVVGGDGKILWIGHPMGGLDRVLDDVLAGKYDIKAEIARQEKAKAEEKTFQEMMKPYSDAMKAKDFTLAISELDKVIARDEKHAVRFAYTRFRLLLQSDEPKAYAYARDLASGIYRDRASELNSIAWTIVDDKTKLTAPDYETAVVVAERAVEITKGEDAMILDTLATAQFKSGDIDKAIETQQKAVALAEKPGSKLDADLRKELKERLEQFRAKKNG